MAPSGEAYNVDWIISNNSDVHVANNRDWFTSFTPFKTYFGTIYTDSRVEVAGIGTVQLNVKLYKHKKPGRSNSRIITLHKVLYAPSSVCNIFGLRCSSNYGFDFFQDCGTLKDKDGNRAGLIEIPRCLVLRLHGQRGGWSSLDAGKEYYINARWPHTERARWDAHQAGQQSISMNGDAPYSTDERAWLKKNYGDEYKFLRSLGLSIYKEEDRMYGRSVARSLMTDDGGEAKGNGSRGQYVGMGERDHDNEDEDDSEDYSEDDADGFLQELEDDPMSHLADYNFSSAELKWIHKHFQCSSKFMLSHGLKPFEQEDCDEAKAIIRFMMKVD